MAEIKVKYTDVKNVQTYHPLWEPDPKAILARLRKFSPVKWFSINGKKYLVKGNA